MNTIPVSAQLSDNVATEERLERIETLTAELHDAITEYQAEKGQAQDTSKSPEFVGE